LGKNSRTREESMSFVNPDDTGDVDSIPYRFLVFRFIGRHRRLARLKECNVPAQIIEAEEDLIQKAYNQMRDKCMKDNLYMAAWEH
jgi:hypothetical protein